MTLDQALTLRPVGHSVLRFLNQLSFLSLRADVPLSAI